MTVFFSKQGHVVSKNSKIEWTDSTWNPVTGCTPVSDGCANCYASRLHQSILQTGVPKYQHDFNEVTCHREELTVPSRLRRPQKIFVCSMSDLFHEAVYWVFLQQVFDVMERHHRHTYQVLTKRPHRMVEFSARKWMESPTWPDNVWAGVTVESSDYLDRVKELRQVPASVHFMCIEPMLGPMPNIDLDGIEWVIVGGETGQCPRPMDMNWARDVRDQCIRAGIPFFFKGPGSASNPSQKSIDGEAWTQFPKEGKP
jgi:protein gp37